jgi:hypothetical protein
MVTSWLNSEGGYQMEEEIRKTAILRYIQGESPQAIYESLKRYESGTSDWYKAKPRAPLRKPTKINDKETQLIVSIRKR